jgi:hypothetical protein
VEYRVSPGSDAAPSRLASWADMLSRRLSEAPEAMPRVAVDGHAGLSLPGSIPASQFVVHKADDAIDTYLL